MKLRHAIILAFPVWLAGCGSSPSNTLSLICGGSLSLAGATSIEVSGDGAGGATLTYPDPVNDGQTGTLAVKRGASCTIKPVAKG